MLLCFTLVAPTLAAKPATFPHEMLTLPPLALWAEHRTQLSDQDWQWLRSKETLILGTFPLELPPFELPASGTELQGLTADVTALIARELGVTPQVRSYATYQDALRALNAGQIDMLGTTSELNNDPALLLSTPYISALPAIFKRTADSWGDPDSSLAGQTLAYNPHYIPRQRLAAEFPKATLKAYDSNMEMFSAVAFGEVDAGLSSSISASYVINTHYPSELRITRLFEIPDLDGYSFALQQKNSRLLRIINAAIAGGLSAKQLRTLQYRWSGGGVARSQHLPLRSEQRAWIAQHPTIQVGVAENFPPFSYFGDDNNFYGITADFLSIIQAETGLHVQIQRFATLQGMFQALESKQIDLAADISPTPQRRQYMAFSRPYMTTPVALVSRHDATGISSIAALSGKTVALPRLHSLTGYIKQHYPTIKLVESRDVPDAFAMVADGEADALIQPLNTARYYTLRLYKDKLRISATLDKIPAVSAFASRREDNELRDIINQSLLGFSPDEISMLSNRWRSQVSLAVQSWRSYRGYIYQGSLIAGLLLLGFLAWNFYLWQQIRKRRRAEHALNEQLLFMDALINGTPHPIYVRDTQMRMLMCNDSYLNAFGATREDVLGKALFGFGELDRDDVQTLEQEHRQVVHEGQTILLDRRLNVRGQPRTLYHWLLPYKSGAGIVVGVIGGWIDISERDELMAKLEAASEQANQANRTKTTFLATMSHEIRTPLNAVIGTLELVLKHAVSGTQDEAMLQAAHRSAQGLLELIGEILDISRIESGKLELIPQRANLKQLIESVVQVFDGLARQKSLTLKLQLDPQLDQDVLIDPLRFKQILSNLVSNAIKFTDHGEVLIGTRAVLTDDNQLSLQLNVIDSGIGITAQDQARLFQAFSQVKERSGGTGLGLMISRSLCEMMGGDLILISQFGTGTQVQVNLTTPRLEALIADNSVPLPATQLPTLDVLIADDHSINRALLSYQLQYLGQQVSSAENGLLALEKWQQQHFDLVITDCNMPLMDGFALTQAIRNQERTRGLEPCIILGLTANAQSQVREQCLEAGMDGCLFKPIELEALDVALRKFSRTEQSANDLDVDFTQLSISTGGNPKMIQILLKEMLSSCRQDLVRLRALSPYTQTQELDALAHRIKGAGKMLKAVRLVGHCESLETACRLRVFEAVTEEQRKLIDYLDNFCSALHDKLGETPAAD